MTREWKIEKEVRVRDDIDIPFFRLTCECGFITVIQTSYRRMAFDLAIQNHPRCNTEFIAGEL